jgi:hypothetical protein
VRHHFLVRRAKREFFVMTVRHDKERWVNGGPAARFLPERARQKRREENLLGTETIHFFPENPFNAPMDTEAER